MERERIAAQRRGRKLRRLRRRAQPRQSRSMHWLALALACAPRAQAPPEPPQSRVAAPPPLELVVRAPAGAAIHVWKKSAESAPELLEADGIDPWTHEPPERAIAIADAHGLARCAVPSFGSGVELRLHAPGVAARAAWKPGDPLALELAPRPSHAVEVRVLDDADRPLAGAAVALWLHREDGGVERVTAATSAADGIARIADVERRWFDGARMYVGADGVARAPIELEIERAALPLAAPLELPWSARPSLALELGGVLPRGAPLLVAAAHADEDGNYTHWTWRHVRGPSALLPGLDVDAALVIEAESALYGLASTRLEPADLAREPRVARLELAAPPTALLARLLAPDGRALAHCWIDAQLQLAALDRRGPPQVRQQRLRTDADGALRIVIGPTLAEFRIRAVLHAEPVDAAPCGVALTALREAGVRETDLGAQRCAAYVHLASGAVRDEQGAPIADAAVSASGQAWGEQWRTTTRADGAFELWGLPQPGAVRVEARGARELAEAGARGVTLVVPAGR
ncbi:MAG: carboxypeptidase regulatory-like domain-containing protein [Planctomycetota bacterium]|nr:MAG: carboxypeptidase regulatory-like domain-containing protein [Planctomycetota bacterium]